MIYLFAMRVTHCCCPDPYPHPTHTRSRTHADKNAETEETRAAAETVFKEVGEAYAVLSDPEKRQKYDNGDL